MAENKLLDARIQAALIAVLISLGGVFVGNLPVDSPEAYQNTYVCDLNANYGVFYGGISGSGYSAYPNLEDRKGAIRCGSSDNRGSWSPILQYIEDNNLNIEEFLLSDPVAPGDVPLAAAGDYLCSPEGCEAI